MRTFVAAGIRSALVALLFASSAQAATYYFVSPNYTANGPFVPTCPNGHCADYTTSMRIEGRFEIPAPLAPNMPLTQYRATATDFTITDGLTTWTMGDPNVRLVRLELATDAAGNVNNYVFFINRWVSGVAPHASGDRDDFFFWQPGASAVLHNSPCGTPSAIPGVPDICSIHQLSQPGVSRASVSATPGTFGPWYNTFSGPSATGSGAISASFTGGGPACTFQTSQFIPLTGHAASPPAGSAPPGVVFPHGLFDFRTTACTPGSTITMTVTYPAPLPGGTRYYKYGPTPTDATPHWYVLPATVAGNTVTFTITDGGLGDDDLAANGNIVDQGGPGIVAGSPAGVPGLGAWGLALLSLLLLGFGLRAQRQGRR